jgi:hypothetical protein
MAEIEGDFVVFLIGARFSKLHFARSLLDLGGRHGMKHMLDYLVARPEKGLLAYEMGLPTIIWRRSLGIKTIPTLTSGASIGAESERATAPASGMRPIWCRRDSTRRSTATCRRAAWARRAAWCPLLRPPPHGCV